MQKKTLKKHHTTQNIEIHADEYLAPFFTISFTKEMSTSTTKTLVALIPVAAFLIQNGMTFNTQLFTFTAITLCSIRYCAPSEYNNACKEKEKKENTKKEKPNTQDNQKPLDRLFGFGRMFATMSSFFAFSTVIRLGFADLRSTSAITGLAIDSVGAAVFATPFKDTPAEYLCKLVKELSIRLLINIASLICTDIPEFNFSSPFTALSQYSFRFTNTLYFLYKEDKNVAFLKKEDPKLGNLGKFFIPLSIVTSCISSYIQIEFTNLLFKYVLENIVPTSGMDIAKHCTRVFVTALGSHFNIAFIMTKAPFDLYEYFKAGPENEPAQLSAA